MALKKLIIPAGEKEQLEVYSHIGPFDKCIAVLKKQKVEVCTSEELAEARALDAKVQGDRRKSELCTNGSWTAENYNYRPNGEILIASRELNPILKQPTEATAAHRNDDEFYLSARIWKALRERAETGPEKAIKSGVLLLPRNAYRSEVPTSAFEEYAPTRFHFRKQAGPYGRFLAEQGIKSVGHYVVDADHAKKQKQSFGRALWVSGLNGWSYLSGGSRDLDLSDGGGVRGVRRSPAERAAPFPCSPYRN